MELLLVSDIHLKITNIDIVSKWLKDNNKKPNIILCSGDIVNLKGKEYDDEEKKNKSIGNNSTNPFLNFSSDDVYNILLELEKICPTCYFIPGNVRKLEN